MVKSLTEELPTTHFSKTSSCAVGVGVGAGAGLGLLLALLLGEQLLLGVITADPISPVYLALLRVHTQHRATGAPNELDRQML